MVIFVNFEYLEKVMEFLNLFNMDLVLCNMVDFGIEGIYYKKVDDIYMENLVELKNYDMFLYFFGNNMLFYLNSNDLDNKWDEFKKFNVEGVNFLIFSFNFDVSNVFIELIVV